MIHFLPCFPPSSLLHSLLRSLFFFFFFSYLEYIWNRDFMTGGFLLIVSMPIHGDPFPPSLPSSLCPLISQSLGSFFPGFPVPVEQDGNDVIIYNSSNNHKHKEYFLFSGVFTRCQRPCRAPHTTWFKPPSNPVRWGPLSALFYKCGGDRGSERLTDLSQATQQVKKNPFPNHIPTSRLVFAQKPGNYGQRELACHRGDF